MDLSFAGLIVIGVALFMLKRVITPLINSAENMAKAIEKSTADLLKDEDKK